MKNTKIKWLLAFAFALILNYGYAQDTTRKDNDDALRKEREATFKSDKEKLKATIKKKKLKYTQKKLFLVSFCTLSLSKRTKRGFL